MTIGSIGAIILNIFFHWPQARSRGIDARRSSAGPGRSQ